MRFLRLMVVLALLSPGPVTAAPGPIGYAFPANQMRVRYPFVSGTACAPVDGITTRVVAVCPDTWCDELGDVYLEKRDAEGKLVGERVRINDVPVAAGSAEIACGPGGRVVVSWDDGDRSCRRFRTYASDLTPTGEPSYVSAPEPCDDLVYSTFAIDIDGSFVAMWHDRPNEAVNRVIARRFGTDAQPLGQANVVSAETPGWRSWPAVGFDPSGVALIAWPFSDVADDRNVVAGRLLDLVGQPVGDEILISPNRTDYVQTTSVLSEGDGIFLVLWDDWWRGGVVGRRVSADTNGAGPTTTTTLPSPLADPHFDSARVLTSYESSGGSPWSAPIIGGAEGRWYVGAPAGNFSSYDDARTWQGPRLPGLEDDPDGWIPDFSSTDGHGLWLALYALGYVDHLDWTRSEDDGATWTPRATLAEWPHLTRDCDDCQILARDVAWGSGGTVIVTWSFSDGYEDYVEGPNGGTYEWYELKVNYAIRSSDGGSSWGELQTLSTGTSPRSGIDVETDGQGTWIVVWSETDLFMTRSEDDGLSWSEPAVIAANAAPPYSSNTEVRHVGDDRWIVVFSSSAFRDDVYGIDEDVFAVASTDGGVTWGEPIPVNLDAREDGATDTSTALSVDGGGRAVVAWESFRPLGEDAHIDADVFAAVSMDGGATWSAASTVNPGADGDTDYDGAPRLLADERGTWLALWQWRADTERYGRVVDKTVVAISGHDCGNGVVEVGEACDDGNANDDDGCDSDCSVTTCGNGLVTGDETCDDANDNDEDGCLSSCIAATCGDGIIWRRVEQCDWGDEIDPTGWCVPGCRYARCGDGFVYEGVEQCDDGNYRGDDACTQQCKPARCGDGYVFTGVEPCDDGNGANDDACVGRCELASCGDGYVWTDVEECDPAVGIQQPYCVVGCRLAHACGDGDGDDAVRVGDALYMLRAAIGLEPVCPAYACDVDRNGTVTILDARVALFAAVGLDTGRFCADGSGGTPGQASYDVVFYLADQRSIASMEIDVLYSPSLGSFADAEGATACTSITPAEYAPFEDEPAEGRLNLAFVWFQDVAGGVDLVRCTFTATSGAGPGNFDVVVTSASNASNGFLSPPPIVGYRFD